MGAGCRTGRCQEAGRKTPIPHQLFETCSIHCFPGNYRQKTRPDEAGIKKLSFLCVPKSLIENKAGINDC